jgi:predicted NUDIX family phosphoesterase
MISASVREVQEEVSLNLNDRSNFAYLGMYPENIPFFVMKEDR